MEKWMNEFIDFGIGLLIVSGGLVIVAGWAGLFMAAGSLFHEVTPFEQEVRHWFVPREIVVKASSWTGDE